MVEGARYKGYKKVQKRPGLPATKKQRDEKNYTFTCEQFHPPGPLFIQRVASK